LVASSRFRSGVNNISRLASLLHAKNLFVYILCFCFSFFFFSHRPPLLVSATFLRNYLCILKHRSTYSVLRSSIFISCHVKKVLALHDLGIVHRALLLPKAALFNRPRPPNIRGSWFPELQESGNRTNFDQLER